MHYKPHSIGAVARWPLATVLAATLALGCSSAPRVTDGHSIETLVASRLRLATVSEPSRAESGRQEVHSVLTLDQAVALALRDNPQLRAELAQLDIAASDFGQAGRLSNPTLSLSARRPDEPPRRFNLEIGVVQNVLELLTRPARKRLARVEYEAVTASVTHSVLETVHAIEAAYIDLVSANHRLALHQRIASAADAAADLADRLHAAGNLSALEQAEHRDHAVWAELEVDGARLRQRRQSRHLARLLGAQPESDEWSVPVSLPTPGVEPWRGEDLTERADRERLDLAASRRFRDAMEEALALSKKWRGVAHLDVGASGEREPDGAWVVGPEIEISLPVFDGGRFRIARSQAALDAAHHRSHALALEAHHEIRGELDTMESLRNKAKRIDSELLPLRRQVVEESQRRYNYMLGSAFELLAAKQHEYEAQDAYLEALTEYWQAFSRLRLAVGGGLELPETLPTKLGAE